MEEEVSAASKTKRPNTDVAFGGPVRRSSRTSTQRVLFVGVFLTALIAINMCAVLATLYGARMPLSSMEPRGERNGRPRSFYDSDGSTPYEMDEVPDIIHIIRHNESELSIMDVVFLRSIYLNHRPNSIMVHCSICGFTGPFVNFTEGISFTFVPHDFTREAIHHSTDMARIRILLEFGGIYLDSDVFVVKSLQRFLGYEATLAFTPGERMDNAFMIFHENSRFLKLYHEAYSEFNDSQWSYNAELPTIQVAQLHPHLVHRLYYSGVENKMDMIDVSHDERAYPNWRDAYAIRTRVFQQDESLRNLNETSCRDLDGAIGQMARSVLFGTSDVVDPLMPVLRVTELAARKDTGEDVTKMMSGDEKPFSGT